MTRLYKYEILNCKKENIEEYKKILDSLVSTVRFYSVPNIILIIMWMYQDRDLTVKIVPDEYDTYRIISKETEFNTNDDFSESAMFNAIHNSRYSKMFCSLDELINNK